MEKMVSQKVISQPKNVFIHQLYSNTLSCEYNALNIIETLFLVSKVIYCFKFLVYNVFPNVSWQTCALQYLTNIGECFHTFWWSFPRPSFFARNVAECCALLYMTCHKHCICIPSVQGIIWNLISQKIFCVAYKSFILHQYHNTLSCE
jgi:hypothetical protein